MVEQHGNLAEVTCLDCGAVEPRQSAQHRLATLNPSWTEQPVALAPCSWWARPSSSSAVTASCVEPPRPGLPVAIVNLGQTRGDALAQVVLTGRAGELLPRLAARWR